MKFMLMIIDDEKAEAALPPGEIDKIVRQHTAFWRELEAAGKYVESRRLRYTAEASRIRRKGGDWVITDGPFAESREVLGGYYLVECDSREEAVEWAKKVPLLDVGAVEVRPARTGAQWRGPIAGAKQFMVLFLSNLQRPHSRVEVFRNIDRHYEVSLELAAQNKFVSSRALEPCTQSVTVRLNGGKHVVTDGPFAESKEVIGGYFVVACDSKEEAIDWAAKLASGEDAAEIRPVWQV